LDILGFVDAVKVICPLHPPPSPPLTSLALPPAQNQHLLFFLKEVLSPANKSKFSDALVEKLFSRFQVDQWLVDCTDKDLHKALLDEIGEKLVPNKDLNGVIFFFSEISPPACLLPSPVSFLNSRSGLPSMAPVTFGVQIGGAA
jgi:hypothetical protein